MSCAKTHRFYPKRTRLVPRNDRRFGSDRVDAVKESLALKLGNNAIPLIRCGKYTAHDNNRDTGKVAIAGV